MRVWWNHLIDRGRQPGTLRMGTAALAVALVVLTLSRVSALAGPQAPPAPHHTRGGHAIPLGGSLPQALTRGTRGAREAGARLLTIAITLGVRHPGALEQLIQDQQNPRSVTYHKYLSPQAFADQFGGAPAAVAAVRQFLQGAGFRVTGVSANRLQINATGTVAQAEQAFHTTISQYQLDQRTVYAPDTLPLLPDTLAANVLGITGLDNIGIEQPMQGRAAQAPARPSASSPIGYVPNDLRAAYDVTPLINAHGDGTGQRVAVFELAPFIPGDLAAYRSQFGLPGSTVNQHSIDGATVACAAGGTNCDVFGIGLADRDVEIVAGLAPNATQDVYTGPNTGTGILDTYQAIATDNVAKIVMTGWGLCEPYSGDHFMRAQDIIFAQMAAQGQSVFAASGTRGADDCFPLGGSSTPNVRYPASDPFVVGVGGTALTLNPGPTYGSEVAWNDLSRNSTAVASGGGISAFFSRPSWQQGANMPTALPQLRLVPDVSANADPVTPDAEYCTSQADCFGAGWIGGYTGTAAAAALWAAITADMNTYLLANAKPAVGWINTTLYQLLGNSQTNVPFHDITSGNNVVNATPGYSAGTCFDAVTGAGSPDAWNLAQDLAGGVHTAGGGACPTPTPPPSTNLIQNGGFENTTSAPWQEFSQGGFEAVLPGFPRFTHAGSTAFYPCVYPSCDDRVWQTVTVPAAVSSATLVYWVDALSSLAVSTPSLACLDHFTVTLATPDGTVFDTVQASCASASFGYVVQAANVTAALQAHLGQPIVVMFRGTTSGITGDLAFSSGWEVDDVALIVS